MVGREELTRLAEAAVPTSEADYGTRRQIDAENAFWTVVHRILTPEQQTDLNNGTYKADTEESVAYGLKLALNNVKETTA